MPTDWGTEQRDVDGPLECSLALETVAAEALFVLLNQQAAGSLPWIGTHDPADAERLPDEQCSRMQRIYIIQLGGPEWLVGADDPRHAVQENGGLADFWYVDDGDILCHPMLVLSNLQAFDTSNVQLGA